MKTKVFVLFIGFIGLLLVVGASAQEVVKHPNQIVVLGEQEKAPLAQEPQKPIEQQKTILIETPLKSEAEFQKTEEELQKKFEEDLAKYGEWVDEDRYGKVWIPNDAKKKDWKPYQDGKWRDLDDNCRHWFSYEPYGYIVYHFGRWQWSPIFGWYWVPGYVWGPAWVYWAWSGPWAYWMPMCVDGFDGWYFRTHYDRYYGRSNSRFWSVVKKDQLKNPNLRQTINATKQTNAIQIASNQLQPNINSTSTLQQSNPRIQQAATKSFSSRINQNRPDQTRVSASAQPNRSKKYLSGLADSPWGNDSRTKNQSGQPGVSRGSGFIRRGFINRQPAARPSSPGQTVSRPQSGQPAVRSSGASRPTAARTTAPRTTSAPRGGAVRRK
jgi:hypothetical protein